MSSTQVLPNEIWTEIFKCCEADSLAADVPLVCKLFVNLTNTNELWQTKCIQRGLDLTLKKPTESFQAFYFFQHIPFFPLFGVEIGITTEKELLAMEGVRYKANSGYATLKQVNFWCNKSNRAGNAFIRMFLVKNIYILPKQWEDFGISYDLSWNSLLIYLREYNHNYQIIDKPTQEEPFKNEPSFRASVQTVGKYKNVYFTVLFTFCYSPGNEDSQGTMYSISVKVAEDNDDDDLFVKSCYDNSLIVDLEYKIQNEDVVRANLAKFLEKNAPSMGHKIRVKPTIVPRVEVNGVHIPNEIWSLIFDFTDDQTLGVNLSQVCKSFSKLSCDDQLWEQKCLKSGRDMKGDEPWKRYYFSNILPLFPLFGCVIGEPIEAELLAANGAKTQERYVTINGIDFWYNNDKDVFKTMSIMRDINPIPTEWIDLGITFEKSYADYLEYFKSRFGNYQVTNAPTQKFYSFMQRASFDATVKVIGRHQNTYFLMTFTFGFVEGNTRSKDTLHTILLRGMDYASEFNDWRKVFEERLIDHKDPVEDPDESSINPDYNEGVEGKHELVLLTI